MHLSAIAVFSMFFARGGFLLPTTELMKFVDSTGGVVVSFAERDVLTLSCRGVSVGEEEDRMPVALGRY